MPFNASALLSWQDEEGRRKSLVELSADLRRISRLPYHPVADAWLDEARHKVFSSEFLQYALPAVKNIPGDWPWQVLTDWDNLKKPDKWFIREGRHQYGRYLRNMFLQFSASEERKTLNTSGRLDEELLLIKNPAGESFARSYATFVQKLSAAQKNENLNMDNNLGVCFKQITEQLLREASGPLARSRAPKV